MIPVLSGVLAGAAHALAGPDHLAAVVPLAIDRRQKVSGWAIGGLWGVGHGLGVVILGLLAQGLMPGDGLAAVAGHAETLVGLMLVGLGLWTLRRARRIVVHVHEHTHGGDRHEHLHVHLRRESPDHPAPAEPSHARRRHHHGPLSLGFGVLHGMAGAGHLVIVVPSLAMAPPQAATYLGGYLIAAVATMTLVGAGLDRLGRAASAELLPRLLAGAGWLSLAVGLLWIGLALAS